MKTLEDLNMQYVAEQEYNEEITGGAILECSDSWSYEQFQEWLPDFDFDMIECVQNWICSECHAAEGMYLKIWVD